MKGDEWVLKVRRYGGGESVICTFSSKVDAQAMANERNQTYQTDTYYVEKFDPELRKGFIFIE